jgi:hypothetical protein
MSLSGAASCYHPPFFDSICHCAGKFGDNSQISGTCHQKVLSDATFIKAFTAFVRHEFDQKCSLFIVEDRSALALVPFASFIAPVNFACLDGSHKVSPSPAAANNTPLGSLRDAIENSFFGIMDDKPICR